MKATVKPPPITKARLGSQLPAMSKKLNTLAGFAIPEIAIPRPNTPPIRNAETSLFMSGSDEMAGDEDSHEGCGQEGRHRDQRARRQPRQPAYAVAARAAI